MNPYSKTKQFFIKFYFRETKTITEYREAHIFDVTHCYAKISIGIAEKDGGRLAFRILYRISGGVASRFFFIKMKEVAYDRL